MLLGQPQATETNWYDCGLLGSLLLSCPVSCKSQLAMAVNVRTGAHFTDGGNYHGSVGYRSADGGSSLNSASVVSMMFTPALKLAANCSIRCSISAIIFSSAAALAIAE